MSSTSTIRLRVKNGKRFDEIVAFAKEQTDKINASHSEPGWKWELESNTEIKLLSWHNASEKFVNEALDIRDNIVKHFSDEIFVCVCYRDSHIMGIYRFENGKGDEVKAQDVKLTLKDEAIVEKVKECVNRICTPEWKEAYTLGMYESDFSELYCGKSAGTYVFGWSYIKGYSDAAIEDLTRQIIAEVPGTELFFTTCNFDDMYSTPTALGRPVNGKIEWQQMPEYFTSDLWYDMGMAADSGNIKEGEQCDIPFDLFNHSEGFKKWLTRTQKKNNV